MLRLQHQYGLQVIFQTAGNTRVTTSYCLLIVTHLHANAV